MEWPGYIRLDSMYGNGDDAPQFATSNRLKHEFIGACDPELENIDERLTLIQSISRLSLRHRTIIYWHFWHNKPQSDIARIIGLSQMQISRDMRAAIKHLREILSESGESSAFERELEWRRSA
jgi:RNA polymerase sigma factor (sigma-70 family)